MSKRHVKAGRKGGENGKGESKRRGDAEFYSKLAKLSAEARRAKRDQK